MTLICLEREKQNVIGKALMEGYVFKFKNYIFLKLSDPTDSFLLSKCNRGETVSHSD